MVAKSQSVFLLTNKKKNADLTKVMIVLPSKPQDDKGYLKNSPNYIKAYRLYIH